MLASGTPPQATEEGAQVPDAGAALATTLRSEFEEAEKRRRLQEEIWLEDLRQYKGLYDPSMYARIGPHRCKLFVRLTRSKVKAMQSKLMELLFPKGDKNWSIKPSPVSEVTPERHYQDVMHLIMVRAQAGIPPAVPPSEQDVKDWIQKEAAKSAAAMSEVINDQLNAINWRRESWKTLWSGHMYGTGIVKGPLTEIAMVKNYARAPMPTGQGFDVGVGKMQMQISARRRPALYNVPIWNLYPDPYARTIEECEYMWERHVLVPKALLETANRLGFNLPLVTKYMNDHRHGDITTLRRFEVDLRTMSNAGETHQAPTGRYELLERWGTIMGWQLQAAGMNVATDMLVMPYECCVFILGNQMVKALLNPLPMGWNPYKAYYLDKDETSLWGEGVPRISRDMQAGFNAAFRMSIDNGAISSGPLIEVNTDLMDDEEDTESIYPWRVFPRRGMGADAAAAAVRVYNVDSHVGEHMEIAKTMKDLSDEVSTVPSYSYGAPSSNAANTLGGLSMLMGQVNLALKDVVSAWDFGISEPCIAGMYDWNMAYHPDESIKGDFECEARGASSLVAKELSAQSHMGFLQATANPMDAPFIKRDYLLREAAKSLDLEADKAVVTEDEAIAARARGIPMPGMAGIPPGGLSAGLPTMMPGGGMPPPDGGMGGGMGGPPQPPTPGNMPGVPAKPGAKGPKPGGNPMATPDMGRPPALQAGF